MKSDNNRLVVYGCEITLHFSHTKQPNHIPENVERMLFAVGVPKYTPQGKTKEETIEKRV